MVQRAAELQSRRRLFLGLLLAHELFAAPVPDEVLCQVRNDRGLAAVAADICVELANSEGPAPGMQKAGGLPYDWLHLRVSDSARAQLRFLLYRMTTPSQPEQWDPHPLGHIALPIQRILRPLHIGVRLIPALWWLRKHRKIQRRHPDTPELA